jgi:hypothetical protein
MFQGSAIILLIAIWYASITQAFVYAYNFNNIYVFCIGIVVAYFLPSILIRHASHYFHNSKPHKIIK